MQTTTKLTYEDYLETPNDGRRYEIIDGELYVNPAPARRHQVAVLNIASLLLTYARTHRTGHVYVAPFDVILSNTDVVQPDVVWVTREHAPLATERGVEGTPDLVVEVLSPSTLKLDEKIKRTRYEHFGVSEYWIVDPEQQRVRVFRAEGQSLRLVEELGAGDTLTSPLLPGFATDVAEFFAEP